MVGLSGGGLFGTESSVTVRSFKDQTGVTFPILLNDRTYFEYADSSAISPFPLDVILDRSGTIRYLRREFDGQAMRDTIEMLLAE